MYTTAGLLLLAAIIHGAPIDDCNTQKDCSGKVVEKGMSKYFPAANANLYFGCTADKKTGELTTSACLQCSNENQVFVERCQKCVIASQASTCELAVETTGAPSQSCDELSSEDVCPDSSNSSYAFKANPEKFFNCFMGERSTFCGACPDFTSFSNKCQKCAFNVEEIEKVENNCGKLNVTEGAGRCDNSFCAGSRPDGDYELTTNSNEYRKCSGGACYIDNCSGDLKYSGVCGQCTYEYVATGNAENCEKKIENVVAAPTYECPSTTWCNGKSTGRYADAAFPGMYFQCVETQAFVTMYTCTAMKCPGSTNFSELNDRCE